MKKEEEQIEKKEKKEGEEDHASTTANHCSWLAFFVEYEGCPGF
jgi:hypothetical protein